MSFDDALHGMYDSRLKPRLLSSIIASYLPDDRQPPKSSSDLSLAVSVIRRHHLLIEPLALDSSGKTVDAYRVAVDAWIERLNALLVSTVPEKCWAGICLLGLTCQECARRRFLDSYVSWFQRLVVHLKPIDTLFLRGAAYASLADLLLRLGSIGVKREGIGLSIKLVQPILQLLSEESSKSIWNNGVDLLLIILKYFPASVKQQSSQVEAILVAKLMEVDTCVSLSQKFARCLALLPKAHGDAATWNSLFKRILLAINSHLDDAFVGMEDGSLAKKVQVALMPRGPEQTWFLGGMSLGTSAINEGARKFWQQLVPRISILMQCCDYLLVNSFPVQVPVPLNALLALIARILTVDGSPNSSTSGLGAPVSIGQQLSLCCELPALHSSALDLLHATLCGVRSQLLPRAADIVRLLTEYFQRCGLPHLRIKLYYISKHLLITLGVGMASELAPVLIDSSLRDLKGAASVLALCSVNNPQCQGWANGISNSSHLSNPRKRKDPGSMEIDMVSSLSTADSGIDISDSSCSLAVEIAALEALEALLTVGGALRAEHWRMEVDSAIASVALDASEASLSPRLILKDISFKGDAITFGSGAFQLAVYRALLASLLSPCTHRPPFLSQALSVFRKGRQEAAGTNVAEFCAHALLTLEPLIHPRSLPHANTLTTNASIPAGRGRSGENMASQMQRPVLSLQGHSTNITATAVANHGFSSQMPLKVNTFGMQMEVEGDPYVHEDIESWIIDYGGEQGILNDSNCLMVEGFDQEFHVMNNLQRGLGHVSARQSLAEDEDRVMMSVVGDMLTDPPEIARTMAMVGDVANEQTQVQRAATRGIISESEGIARPIVGDMLSESTDPQRTVGEHTFTSMKVPHTVVGNMLTVSADVQETRINIAQISSIVPNDIIESENFQLGEMNRHVSASYVEQTSKTVLAVDILPTTVASSTSLRQLPIGHSDGGISVSTVGTAEGPQPNDLGKSQEPFSSRSTTEAGFAPVLMNELSESDSDAIPDIVDGDPDSDQ